MLNFTIDNNITIRSVLWRTTVLETRNQVWDFSFWKRGGSTVYGTIAYIVTFSALYICKVNTLKSLAWRTCYQLFSEPIALFFSTYSLQGITIFIRFLITTSASRLCCYYRTSNNMHCFGLFLIIVMVGFGVLTHAHEDGNLRKVGANDAFHQ